MTNNTRKDSSCLEKKWSLLSNPIGWVQLIIINIIIAVILTLVSNSTFFNNLIFSQIIGFSIVATLSLHVRFRHLSEPDLWALVTGIPFGAIIGITVSLVVTGISQNYNEEQGLGQAFQNLLLSIVIGSSITWYFFMRGRYLKDQAQLAEQLSVDAVKERQLAQAKLALLQAQIEPHFLFNTLSNVVSLIDFDTTLAKKMLESLGIYLRATLKLTRQTKTTVLQEVQSLDAYLSIFQIRMGERLQYSLIIDEHCNEISFPPLLLQPLVENAIKHGLEPQVEGGEIVVKIEITEGNLICQVLDTGRGIITSTKSFAHSDDEKVGLSNVRERLLSLYGENAKLTIVGNNGGGVISRIEIPLASMDL